jgi:hypothetical protein
MSLQKSAILLLIFNMNVVSVGFVLLWCYAHSSISDSEMWLRSSCTLYQATNIAFKPIYYLDIRPSIKITFCKHCALQWKLYERCKINWVYINVSMLERMFVMHNIMPKTPVPMSVDFPKNGPKMHYFAVRNDSDRVTYHEADFTAVPSQYICITQIHCGLKDFSIVFCSKIVQIGRNIDRLYV